jgi:hypothetical protein
MVIAHAETPLSCSVAPAVNPRLHPIGRRLLPEVRGEVVIAAAPWASVYCAVAMMPPPGLIE